MSPDLPWLLILLGACTDAVTRSRGRDLSADTWQAAGVHWRGWLRNEIRYDDGSGYGCGDGYGDGYGDGHGYGYGAYGYGNGYGEGYGYGDSYGDGDGYGEGNGDGYESGSGHGDGSGDGYDEQTWRDVVALEFDDGTRLGGDVRAAAIGLLGARLDEIEA